jgi:hypothetical protein
MTLREWLEIVEDIDGYIASGGQLLDLNMQSVDDLPPKMQEIVLDRLGPEKLDRIERFFQRVAMHLGDDTIRQHLSEEMLRAIWHETAGPSSESTH